MRFILVGVAVVCLTFTATVYAQTVTWNPTTLARTVVTPSTVAIDVSFTTDSDIQDARLWIVPELARFIVSSTTELGDVQAGDTVSLRMFIDIPEHTTIGQIQGTFHILIGRQRTVARPLPITLTVVPPGPPSECRVTPVPDQTSSVLQVVGVDGGVLRIASAYGPTYTLTIPAGALIDQTPISITPLANVLGLPLSALLLGGVHLGPEGLLLALPATLAIDLPTPASGTVLGFAYVGNGDTFHVTPAATEGSRVTLYLRHFSGAGGFVATEETCASLAASPPISAEALTEQLVACAEFDQQSALDKQVAWYLGWWGISVEPALRSACTVERLSVAASMFSLFWARVRMAEGMYPQIDEALAEGRQLLAAGIQCTTNVVNTDCSSATSCEGVIPFLSQ